MWYYYSKEEVEVIHLVIKNNNRLWCSSVFLLDEAEAVEAFVQVEVGVFPGLHDGLFSLKSRRDGEKLNSSN